MTNEADKPVIEGLKPCPFCRYEFGLDLIDSLYPSGTYWVDEPPHGKHYVSHRDRVNYPEFKPCWNIVCGGCTAEVHGDSKDEAVAAWNRRASEAAPAAQPVQEPVARIVIVPLADGHKAKVIRALDEKLNSKEPWIARVPEGTLLYAAPAAQPATPLREVLSDLERVRKSLHEANEVGLIGDVLWAGPAETTFDALDGAIAALRSRLDGEKT